MKWSHRLGIRRQSLNSGSALVCFVSLAKFLPLSAPQTSRQVKGQTVSLGDHPSSML